MKLSIKGKIIDAEICDTLLKRSRGLMFRKNPKPLFFVFKKLTTQPIHSFFCKPFMAIWLNEGRVVDEKIVRPYKLSIKARAPFTHLVEIPLEEGDNEKSPSA